MELVRRLRARAAAGKPVAVGIVGCGQMGSGLAHAVSCVEGMQVAAIADVDLQRARGTFAALGVSADRVVEARSVARAEDALRAGRRVIVEDALAMAEIPSLEVNVEATGVPDVGAQVAYRSIMARKPIVMLNVETDITVGVYLSDLARRTGALYTVASGDEPGVLKMLYEQARLMGFEVVTLGKGKNNPIDRAATVESCRDEAAAKGMNPKMLAAFRDGTKTMVEMAAVSNATGLLPDVPGMHGPKVELEDLLEVFVPAVDGGIFSRRGVVDFSTGAIAPGVFAIVRSDEPRIRKEMKFITRADGPYYLHHRPYHLCDLETPQSIAEAVLLGEVTVAPDALHADVICVAKRDLRAGSQLDGIGGHDWYGLLVTHPDAARRRALPIGIGAGARMLRDVARGEWITLEDAAPDTSTFVYRLRMLQEALLDGAAGEAR
jgi:predicted homoserine dehydrogenase-like protein